MTKVVSWIILIGSILCGLYVGGWIMFIQPIIEACRCFDAGTLTGAVIGSTIVKCALASFVTSIIVSAGVFIVQIIDKTHY